VVIVNLSSLAEESQEAMGRFLVAMIFGFIKRRQKIPQEYRVPVDLILDEAELFVGNDLKGIFEQARKFGLACTLAQQTVGQGMSSRLSQSVIENTDVKIMGKSGPVSQSVFSKCMGIPVSRFGGLYSGRFIMRAGSAAPIRVRMPSFYLDNRSCVQD